ncbi:MAG: phage BR0599 family protein [Opitutus sp.]|nr:phage BR0599 family protein [Opitutus sp.]MCS6244626.1 phage BR0599 family protein [Opitutus sp.]MCS6248193.1 phage BR0599 family protein [Opitutus sp.]MCS6274515.1 phage BR0599 family protein [Opitutus sp.]MCS6275937.1 phage BR0599 family protein [Opitutus sp.]
MIPLTYNSQSLYLLDDLPDWGTPIKATASLLTAQESGLTDREARRAHGETLRLRLRYQIKVSGTDARQLAAGLRAHQNEPVCAPLWPAACAWSARASADITGGLKAVFPAAGGTPRIYQTGDTEPSSPTPSANDTLVPLVVGYLESRDLRWITDGFCSFDVALVENSPAIWAITPAAYTAPAGPLPSGYGTAPRLFPFLTHWDGPRTGYTLRIARDEIGFGRQTSDVARAAAVARTVEQTAWASTADGWSASKLLAFFAAHGAGASFWASGQQSAAVLASNLAASATTATVTDTTGLVIGDRLGLVQKGQLTGWVGPLTTIASPTISFLSSGNAASPAATTSLVPLLLARFDSPKLELEWITDRLATASFRVRELPPELALPAGETLGTTLGNLTPRAWIYLFERNYEAGGTIPYFFTSYERDLYVDDADPVLGGATIAFTRITHGDIKTGLALDRDELSIDCDGLDVAPLLDVALLRMDVPLTLRVYRAILIGGIAYNLTAAWSGEVVSASIKGKRISAKATALGSAFDRKAPRFYLQPGCNHGLFSMGCGLSKSTFVHTAILTAVGTAGFPYTFTIGSLARSGGAVLTAADIFAGGWADINPGMGNLRAILASTAVVGGSCVLTLSGDPSPFPSNGTAILIYPGCDGRRETCAGTFNNYANFGGHPFVPTGNPSLFKLSSDAGSGGKK